MLGTQQFQVWKCVVPCTVLGLLALNWEMTVLFPLHAAGRGPFAVMLAEI